MTGFAKLPLEGAYEFTPARYPDSRGVFEETYNRDLWRSAGVETEFVQDNRSVSVAPFTLRGLHFQRPPFAQAKLVRVGRGRIFDVLVDLRRASPTYGRHVAVELSAEAGNQVLVPAGFAHAFLTLVPDTEVLYKVSAPYSREHDGGIRWDDPALDITWPLDGATPVLSAKDDALPLLADIPAPFPGA
ncbi:MAG: dTDP-4-dehydrorhamnose 3,5-epimerase [Bauldia sp.]|nr:dTDP-4-dehydrorhamnose 3,5-epimerase [Bauldia sp.]